MGRPVGDAFYVDKNSRPEYNLSTFYTLVFLGISHGRGKEKKDGVLETEHRNAPSATVLWQVKVPVVGLRHMGRWCHLNTVKMG